MVIKSLFLSILFDDQRYAAFSELELAREYADLCLLARPDLRRHGAFDFLFELKLVRRKELGEKGRDLREMERADLRRIPRVLQALTEGEDQIQRYRLALEERFGESTLRLRSFVVVAVGLERLVAEEIKPRKEKS